jgi:predicted nuclease of restriction endonuclease-like (RecB) superfamily
MEKKKFKKLPKFKSEDQEREFWKTHETSDYVDWSKAQVIREPNAFPNLKLSDDLMEFKLPVAAAKKLKSAAEKQKISSSDLARKYVLDGLKRDQQRANL